MSANVQVILRSRPVGWLKEDDFCIVESPAPRPDDGEVLVKNEWLSLDPYMRGRMNEGKSYLDPVPIGEVMAGQTVGEVLESKHPIFAPGDKVLTQLGWQLYGVAPGAGLSKIDATRAPASCYLGVLGVPGMTAWFGLNEIGQPRAGETVVVSAAAGAVGSVAGQLARIKGCRVVGIAGGREKCDYAVNELGFDACVDHKAGTLLRDLRAACPDGVDVNFENVGGEVLDTVLRLMNPFSRVVVCGLIAEYNATEPHGCKMLQAVLTNRIRMQGMMVFDWRDRYREALKGLGGMLAEGILRYRESVVEGIENAPKGLIALFEGQNFGKQLVRLQPRPLAGVEPGRPRPEARS